MSSYEVSQWMALCAVEAEEADERALLAESGDGQVFIDGRLVGTEDDDDEEDDVEPV